MWSVCLPQTRYFSLTSPSVSNQIILLPCLQKCRFCLSTAFIKPCPYAFLGQFLHYHPWPWSSHRLPSNGNYLTNAPLELDIKWHSKQNSYFQIREGTSFLACFHAQSCLLDHTHLVHLFSKLISPGPFYSITKSYRHTWCVCTASLVFLQLSSVLSLLKIKSEAHQSLEQHSAASQIRVCPWVARTSLHVMPYKHPPAQLSSRANSIHQHHVKSTDLPWKGQSKDDKSFVLKTLAYYFDSLCSRHQPGEISFQGPVSLNCNRISLNIHSVLCAFCPFWQEKVLLIARLFNKEIPQRVFAENIQKSTDSCCDGCSFLG